MDILINNKNIILDDNQINDYIEPKSIYDNKYLVDNKLIVNSEKGNLLNELKISLRECESFYFSVAFINFSGIQLLLDTFKELDDKGIKGKIITSTYLNFTEPKALDRIRLFNNIDLKVFITSAEVGFHTKAYIFENKDNYKIIIGSSNITQSALKSNVEWNVRVISKRENLFVEEVINEYNNLWKATELVDDNFIRKYESFIREVKRVYDKNRLELKDYEIIKPNIMQSNAIESLDRLRKGGENKALVIAATGAGKTYMSAFDVINFKPKKMLFLVHREEILRSAEETFKKLAKNKDIKTGLLTGSRKDLDSDYLFSTIQSMNNNLEKFSPDHYEYIVVDEAHHAASPTYKRVMDYFKPKFLLGMTATPERGDSENIFNLFDNNLALEVRLHEALEQNLVIPFHYFGITDIEGVNLSDVKLDNMAEVATRLKINERVDFIIEKMNFYGYSGDTQKTIGFCITVDHAEYMANEFNKRGIESICLVGSHSPEKRAEAIRRLQSDEDDLKVIFTVDIFNEGVDIPTINQVLMLRPTNSPIVFIQQLGRGLRKHNSKEFLTVLDFIGNHNKAFLIAIALNGSRYYDKDSLKVAVATEFANVPGCTNIQMDRISQERILEQLSNENFNTLKYLKEEYNEFKAMRSGKISYALMDYFRYDGAPDPIKFSNYDKTKTYLGFVAKVEKDEELNTLLSDDNFIKILKEISIKLPIKRPYEFILLRYLLNHREITIEQGKKEALKYLDTVDEASIIHSMKYLSQTYYDAGQLKTFEKSFEFNGEKLIRLLHFEKVLINEKYRCYIEDVINYGLVRYEKQYGSKNYGVPFFKLYEQYQMVDTALLSNYEKIHSSFRGSGLITNGSEYFLFVDLHKEEDVKESINYKDELKGRDLFQWQTPNSTAQGSERGKNIIFNKERSINIHIFIRKYKEIDGVVQPYIYIGKGDTIHYEGEKPITVLIKLENIIPVALYTEFTMKV